MQPPHAMKTPEGTTEAIPRTLNLGVIKIMLSHTVHISFSENIQMLKQTSKF